MKRLWQKYKKKVFGSLAFLMFFLMYGTVGAIECDTLPLFEGTIRLIIFLALWVLFAYLAGGFENYAERGDKQYEVQTVDAYTCSGRPCRQGPHSSGRRTYHH